MLDRLLVRLRTEREQSLGPWIHVGRKISCTRRHSRRQLLLQQLESRQLLAANGLAGEYFNETDLTGFADARIDPVVHFTEGWDTAPAGTAVIADSKYSERWTGFVNIDRSGDWIFSTTSNDGVRLWVNEVLIIDHWNRHTATEDSASVNLDAGWYPVRLEHFQNKGSAEITLSFEGPGVAKTIIPSTHLNTMAPETGEPVAEVGDDRFVVLPENLVVISGSGSDSDGVITAYQWKQMSGPNPAQLSGETTPELTASGLTEGTYEFQLLVTDNDSKTASDTVQVHVIPEIGDALVSGEAKQWHRTTITLDGPPASETDGTNPFLDYRFNVTFTGPSGQVFLVPGFFAADGDAGRTHASVGNKWRVHFSPNEAGQWSYLTSFRSGTNVAVDLDPAAGAPVAPWDGVGGTFEILPSDKVGRDFRAADHGLIKNRGGHYLTFADGGVFIKGGTNVPENFFGYGGFDNTPSAGHDFDGHVADWFPGDPDWDSDDADAVVDDGRSIIGALNFIAGQGANSIYFLPMNIGGDGQDTFPTVAEQDKTHYDVSKLDQWEQVFQHADRLGVFLHVQLAETEASNENYHDNGTLGAERQLYYRELVARFGHHLGLQWDLGEENGYGTTLRTGFADYLKSIDAYDHPLTTHTRENRFDHYYAGHLGNGDFDMTAFQANLTGLNLGEVENEIEHWRRRSAEAGTPWVISVDEPQAIENDKTDVNLGYPHGRTAFLWPIYLSGGGGFEWYVKQDGGGHSFDQEIDDFHAMDVALQWTGHAIELLGTLPLLEMSPEKALGGSTAGGTTYVLQKLGEVYALYNEHGGTFHLDLADATGTFDVTWFDPRGGGPLQVGTVQQVQGGGSASLGQPPSSVDEDWVALVQWAGAPLPQVSITASDASAAEQGQDSGQFAVERTGDTAVELMVHYTISGSADAGDYLETLSGTLVIPAGESSAPIDFTPLDDDEPEGAETLELTVVSGAGYAVGSPASAAVILVDDEIVNVAPSVDAGPAASTRVADSLELDGTVTDDGLPSSPGNVTAVWTLASGPGQVSFGDARTVDTTVTFDAAGVYALRLTADDSDLQAFDEVTVTVDPAANQTLVGETGIVTVDQASAGTWHAVSFNGTFLNPVVSMGPPSFNSEQPVTMRLRNVMSTGFEFQMDRWDYLDGSHVAETIGWMAVEAGTHVLDGGTVIHAGVHAVDHDWTALDFGGAFADIPIVLPQVASAHDEATVTVRIRNVLAGSAEVKLQEQERFLRDGLKSHAAEDVHVIAIEPARGEFGGAAFIAAATANAVEHHDFTIDFAQTFTTPIFLAAMQTTDGSDVAALRYKTLDAGGATIFIQEEQSYDAETSHTTEVVGYAVFERTGSLFTAEAAPVEAFQSSGSSDDLVSIDSTSFDASVAPGGHAWEVLSDTGATASVAASNTGTNHDTGFLFEDPRWGFHANFFIPDAYHVWVLGRSPLSLSTGDDDLLHAGFDRAAVTTSDRISGFGDRYGWSTSTTDGPAATLDVLTGGLHVLHVWMGGDGFIFDNVVLTAAPNFTRIGGGSGENRRA